MKIIFSTIFCLTSIRKERVGKKYHIIFFFNIPIKKMEMKAPKKNFYIFFENEDYFIVTQTLLFFLKRYKNKNSFFFISVLNSIII